MRGAASLAILLHSAALPAATLLSDRLIVLEADARSHTVQHTLVSDGVLATLTLPGSVIPQRVVFGGPEREVFATAFQGSDGRVALWSGNAFVRYRHQYTDAVRAVPTGQFELATVSVPDALSIDDRDADGRSARIDVSLTWMFPGEMQAIDWRAEPPGAGTWSVDSHALSWRQDSATPAQLTVRFGPLATRDPAAAQADAATAPPTDDTVAAVRDDDGDGVDDAIDICLGPVTEGVTPPDAPRGNAAQPLPGCDGAVSVVLQGIGFATGEAYLDLTARRVLDRVAQALAAHDDGVLDIAAHTDSVGTRSNNQRLSARRARAVRQYLLLRGADPARLFASGYGEAQPLADNASELGRQRNRRIELRPFSPPEAGTR